MFNLTLLVPHFQLSKTIPDIKSIQPIIPAFLGGLFHCWRSIGSQFAGQRLVHLTANRLPNWESTMKQPANQILRGRDISLMQFDCAIRRERSLLLVPPGYLTLVYYPNPQYINRLPLWNKYNLIPVLRIALSAAKELHTHLQGLQWLTSLVSLHRLSLHCS